MANAEAGRQLRITNKLHSIVTELTSSRSKQMILLETIAITSICFMISLMFRPNDPLCLNASFPWLLLVPLLIALGFGLLPGLLSIALIIASGVALSDFSQLDVSTLPMGYLLGGLFMTLLTGEYRDYWQKKVDESVHDASIQTRRYHQLEKNYHALKASHDTIESKFTSDPNSLRRAVHSVKARLSGKQASLNQLTESDAEIILELLSSYGDVSEAALFAVKSGEAMASPLASTGDFGSINRNSEILVNCLETKKAVSKRFDSSVSKQNDIDPYLICIPMLDEYDEMAALFVVKNMAYYSFEPRTVNLMSILAANIADSLMPSAEYSDQKTSTVMLHKQILRAVNHLNEFQVPTVAVAMLLQNKHPAERFIQLLRHFLRDTDTFYLNHTHDGLRVVLLLKMTDDVGIKCALARLKAVTKHQFEDVINLDEIIQDTYSLTDSSDIYGCLINDLGLNPENEVQTNSIPRSSAA